MFKLVVIFLTINLIACTPTSDVNVTHCIASNSELNIAFEGRGAGAGMMLSSTMGPMGIAIGFAIDEGIKKDINKAFNAAGYTLVDVVDSAAKALDKPINVVTEEIANKEQSSCDFKLEKLGLKAIGDRVVPDIQLGVMHNQRLHTLTSKPEYFPEDLAIDFSIVKEDAAKVRSTLVEGLRIMLEKAVEREFLDSASAATP